MSRSGNRRPQPESRDEGPWVEPGEVAAGLLLFAPAGLTRARLSAELAAPLATGAVAALIVDAAMPGRDDPVLADCRTLCRRHAVACLVEGDAGAALDARADGVFLYRETDVAPARRLLGPDRIVGAACGLSRHAAMVAGEAGADYVMFGALDEVPRPAGELFELVAWWNELFVLPCAAAGRLTPDLASALTRSGADLLAVSGSLLAAADDPAGLARALNDAARGVPGSGQG